MASYNPRTPAVLGMEWRPTIQTDITLSGTSAGLAMRIVPGSTTLDALHPFIKSVVGTPGIAVEVLSTLERPVATTPTPLADGTVGMGEHHYIGTNSGLISTGWERQDNDTSQANLRGALDDFPPNTTDYIRNSSSLAPNGKLQFAGRGADSALTGKRIDAIEIVVFHRTNASTSTTKQGPRVQGYLNLSGQTYLQDRNIRSAADGKWRQPAIGFWTQNPSTNKPWTLAEVNNLVATTASDEWGLQIDSATVAAEGYNVSMLVMVVFTTGVSGGGTGGVGDVRKGFYYQQEPPSAGWNSFTLGSTAAESSATYYYLHVYPLSASGSFTIPVLRDPRTNFRVTTAASETGEHRQVYQTSLSQSGVVQGYTALPGSMIPILCSASGTNNSQSQAFAEISPVIEYTGATANLAQQVTSSGTPPLYKSVRVPLGWESATQPDAPLNIQIQHGASASTGGGTLLASIYVQPDEISQQLIDRSVTLGAGITPPANTELYALIDSAATSGAGWKVGRLDTRTDAVIALTSASVEGQSQGGQTNAMSYGATDYTRFDIPFALVGDPGEVGGTPATTLPTLTATAEAGV